MSTIKDKLKKMNARYKESEAQAKAMFGEIEAGIYNAKLANGEMVESKNSGNLQIKRCHTILDGEFKGAKVYDYLQLESEYGFAFVREWLTKLGYECPDELVDLPEVLEELSQVNPSVQIKIVKSDKGFTNVKVLAVIDDVDDTGTEEVAEVTEDVPAEDVVDEVAEETVEDVVGNASECDPELLNLASAYGAEVSEDMDNDTIISTIGEAGIKFLWKELTKEEQEVVLRFKLQKFIDMGKKEVVKPTPKPVVVSKPTSKLPVRRK